MVLRLVLTPYGGRDGGGGVTGGGDLSLLDPEYCGEIYCDYDHYGSVSGVEAEARANSGNAVVETGWSGNPHLLRKWFFIPGSGDSIFVNPCLLRSELLSDVVAILECTKRTESGRQTFLQITETKN